ncbi:multicopper oxidase domain-containing protein [Myxococcus sp. RHSTA-1-4]|uniref:multicopper oxidase domain-containing protein n=1 Tax=Myxococcus sp. RHSTA-1-4 TaxID=2874601 RepID=UPI001CBC8DB8|nr:multicopper oxidase domain-containing protein [Myxococcus sp. RHSTA-1-4]MBZ4420660.1 multicopper oxidase domain-containing protein [Myxococcus sp. RHSTA-1-4]
MMKALPRLALLLVPLLLAAGPARAAVSTQCPPDTDGVDTDGDGNPANDHVCIHLAAGDGFADMANGRLLYVFGFSNVTGVPNARVMQEAMLGAQLPAPTLVVKQGQRLYLTLTNVGMMMRPDLFDAHSVHWHGFPNAAPIFDGVPEASIAINMGASLTYFYAAELPGTYMYHCHVEAAEHIQMGMVGNLYVLPAQDGTEREYPAGSGRRYRRFAYNDGDGSTGYDVAAPIQLASLDPEFHDASLSVQPLPFAAMRDTFPLLNGRGYPATVDPLPRSNSHDGRVSQPVSSLIRATRGQRILLRLSSLSTTEYFTLTVPGISMQVVGRDARLLRGTTGENLYQTTTTLTLGGGESADVILDTAAIPPGTYFLHTTHLHALSNDTEDLGGMMTEIVITP